jgi:hypothetical protein
LDKKEESDMALWLPPQVRVFLLEQFRSLDAALDEHKAKGTKPGDPVYEHIFKELADDVAQAGVGVDRIDVAAYAVGQISTYNRLRSLMPKQFTQEEQEAFQHLQSQINALMTIRASRDQSHANSAQFVGWKSTTTDLMKHYLPADSEHLRKFRSLSFRSNIMLPDYPGVRHSGPRRDDLEKFASDADVAVACLEGAMQRIRMFGLKQDEPAAPARTAGGRGVARGGITQHIHGNVNQAIATGRATQNIGQIGSSGNSLDEIVKLLQESYELNRREMDEAFGAAQQLDAEEKKPEGSKNWKSIADWGNTLLGIAGKATDLTEKLAPHLPWLTQLIEQAMRHG